MTTETPCFILPHVIERVVTGQFVAQRRSGKAYPVRDRRNNLLPLNITRRAITYEPLVFANRRADLIETAQKLNDPETKVLMVTGPGGRGKTAFVRGLVELMGGEDKVTGLTGQLLWFDVSRHTDFDEIIRFAVEYMTYLCQGVTLDPVHAEAPTTPTGKAALQNLGYLLAQVSRLPILVVIDNVEFLLTPDQRFRSPELMAAFRFLLSFPNIKLVLAGRQVPLVDMPVGRDGVTVIALDPLTPTESRHVLTERLAQNAPESDLLAACLERFHGEPVFLNVFSQLYLRFPDPAFWHVLLAQGPGDPEGLLLQVLQRQLSPDEQRILGLCGLLRHGITLGGLETLIQFCDAAFSHVQMTQVPFTLFACVFKKVYPPQMVLGKLRRREDDTLSEGQEDIQAYYQVSDRFQEGLAQTLSDTDRAQFHDRLSAFYLAEKDKHLLARVYPARTSHLAAEAQYHLHCAKRERRRHATPPLATPLLPEAMQHPPHDPPTREYSREMSWPEDAHGSMMSVEPCLTTGSDSSGPPGERRQRDPRAFLQKRLPPEIWDRLEKTTLRPEPEALAETLITMARDDLTHGRRQTVLPMVRCALALLKESDHHALRVSAYSLKGQYHWGHADYEAALSALSRAIRLAQAHNLHPPDLTQALLTLGDVYAVQHDVPHAAAAYRQALTENPEDKYFQAETRFQLALILDEAGDLDAAQTAYADSVQAYQAIDRPDGCANALYNLAGLQWEAQQFEAAKVTLETGLAYDKMVGKPHEIHRSMMLFSRIEEALHHPGQAWYWAEEALRLALSSLQSAQLASTFLRLGHLAEWEADWPRAVAYYEQAQQIGDTDLSAESRARIHKRLLTLREQHA